MEEAGDELLVRPVGGKSIGAHAWMEEDWLHLTIVVSRSITFDMLHHVSLVGQTDDLCAPVHSAGVGIPDGIVQDRSLTSAVCTTTTW